jgi:hypothetical protein
LGTNEHPFSVEFFCEIGCPFSIVSWVVLVNTHYQWNWELGDQAMPHY